MVPGTQTTFIEANGIRFEVAVAQPVHAGASGNQVSGKRKLALLLHGFPELNFSWRDQISTFTNAGYTVWAPNLRGYGDTSRPEGIDAYRLDVLIDDVAGLIDAAKAEGLADEICLVSHDWGGAIAWSFLLGKKREIDRFIVMNLPHPKRFVDEFKTWKQFKRSWYTFFFQIPWLPEKLLGAKKAEAIGRAFHDMAVDKSRFPDDVLNVYREAALKPGALTAMVNYYRAAMRRQTPYHDLWREPPVIEVPTLMIWGEEDSALCVETTDKMDPLMSDFTLRRLPGVSHWVQQEAPETVNAMIAAWLGGIAVPQAADLNRLASPPPQEMATATSSAAQ
ncbi:alpha/beta hydrolase [Pyruvatibacter sp.]|uniref:alpha/beta fold hydrolase n=1 Tax=Pyruvatibacter sp. TaxID=1981328 RepID=UPI0032679975